MKHENQSAPVNVIIYACWGRDERLAWVVPVGPAEFLLFGGNMHCSLQYFFVYNDYKGDFQQEQYKKLV